MTERASSSSRPSPQQCQATSANATPPTTTRSCSRAGSLPLAAGVAAGGRIAPAPGANPAAAIALLVYMGFISAAAYSVWSATIAANGVSRVAVFGFVNPIFGVILSAILLGETDVLSPALAVVSLVLVCAGIVIVNRQD